VRTEGVFLCLYGAKCGANHIGTLVSTRTGNKIDID